MGLDMNLYRKKNTEIMYWRKANAIHNWFVTNCNNGEDNNGSINVYGEQLQELLEAINNVLDKAVLVKGKIHVSTMYEDGKEIKNYEEGMVVDNPEVCEKYLPSTSGFFFGSTEYDEYYINDLKETKKMLEEELNNPDNQYADYEYVASW